jgi:hypothetical protein
MNFRVKLKRRPPTFPEEPVFACAQGGLTTEIRALKMGAFAPLTEQPFIRAALFPGAALGLLAVGQRLLDIF